jgi:hypothetical protein
MAFEDAKKEKIYNYNTQGNGNDIGIGIGDDETPRRA